MAGRYEIRASISREKARELLALLARDDDFRARVEETPRTVLFEYRIDVSHDTLPEQVSLPEKEAIEELLARADAMVPESASPFGLLALFVVFGAMPVVAAGPPPAGDGAG
jgi:hypothetical protein